MSRIKAQSKSAEELNIKADAIMDFQSNFYEPKEPIHFYAQLNDTWLNHYNNQYSEEICVDYIAGIQINYLDNMQKVYIRNIHVGTTTRGSNQFHNLIRKLEAFNEQYYDIFFTPNPLMNERRMKTTTREIRTFVIESDDLSLKNQMIFLKMIDQNLCTAVYTGNRSIHMYMPLTPSFKNFDCIYSNEWKKISKLDNEDRPDFQLPLYDSALTQIKTFLNQYSFNYDTHVLSNFACLLRVPYFSHSKTGKTARVIYSNDSFGFMHDAKAPWSGIDSLDISQHWENQWCKEMGSKISIDNLEKKKQVTTMEDSNDKKKQRFTSFLDHLAKYDDLIICGITSQGQRTELHKTMYTCASVYGWDETTLANRWREILSINPENNVIPIERAVKDLRCSWNCRNTKKKRFKTWMPRGDLLPELTDDQRVLLKVRLKEMGCKTATSTAHIITRICYPVIKRSIPVCIKGSASIMKCHIKDACNRYKYNESLKWLDDNNVLRLTNEDYVIGYRSMLYFVNVPLVLHLLGFKNKDLAWDVAK